MMADLEAEVVDQFAQDIDRLLNEAEQWPEEQKEKIHQLLESVESFHAAAIRQLLAAIREGGQHDEVLKHAVSQPLVYAVLRRLELLRPGMTEQIEHALNTVRPALQQHGGDVELVSITSDKTVQIRLLGACDGCGSSQITLSEGVDRAIHEHCDWVAAIEHLPSNNRAAPPDTPTTPGEHPVNFVSPFSEAGS